MVSPRRSERLGRRVDAPAGAGREAPTPQCARSNRPQGHPSTAAMAQHPSHGSNVLPGLDQQYRLDDFGDASRPEQSYGHHRERRHGPQTPAQPYGQLRVDPQDNGYDSMYETTDTGGPLATPFWTTDSGNAGTPATVPSSVSPTPFRQLGWNGMYAPPSTNAVPDNMMQSGMGFSKYVNQYFNRVSPQQQIDPSFEEAGDRGTESVGATNTQQTFNRIGGQEHGHRPDDEFHRAQSPPDIGASNQASSTPADPIHPTTIQAGPPQSVTQYKCPECDLRFDTRSDRR